MSMVGRISIDGQESLLHPDQIRVGLAGRDKETVLNGLIDIVADHPGIIDIEGVRRAVFEREAILPTGVGKGLALPHAKTSAAKQIVTAFAITEEPIVFEAIDNEPVRLLFLLISTERAKSQHIKLLGRVSRLMNEDAFRYALLEAPSPEAVMALFEDAESALASQ